LQQTSSPESDGIDDDNYDDDKIGCEEVDWLEEAKDRLGLHDSVTKVIDLSVP
jgi:hypothetical protein